tara:strand:- start:317 stop:469 length:153 start_codon:yes stop_codon:yes gene_type:complete
MSSFEYLEKRIENIEKQVKCKDLEKRLNILENEINHIKKILQYQMRNKNK